MRAPAPAQILPGDRGALLVGRVWDADRKAPRIVAVQETAAVDISGLARTVSELLELPDAAQAVKLQLETAPGESWPLQRLLDASFAQDRSLTHLLAPIDLQVVKACGVTFVDSMIERVIEERAGGDANRAADVRGRVMAILGGSLSSLRPGSPEAERVKESLIKEGMWSQYLEVGIGPNPEVFTKGPVLSSVGVGASVGIPRFSDWNNPEPELVLVVNSAGAVVGASLGNDVNLRDVEGRSALLLGMAKDNNASTAVGPFIRLFDDGFSIEDLRSDEIALEVRGTDGFELHGRSSLGRISRPFEELVAAASGDHHQYPDGFALFTGTLFAPTQDRDGEGEGFTHRLGDVVTISNRHLGSLINDVGRTEELPRWDFGISALIASLR